MSCQNDNLDSTQLSIIGNYIPPRRVKLAFLRLYSLGVAGRRLLSNPKAGQLLGHGLSELGVRHRVHDGVNAACSLC